MKVNTEVLTDYLNEQCDKETERNVERWINENSRNKSYYEELRFYWDKAPSKPIEFDSEQGLKKLKKKKAAVKQFRIRKFMRYAALIALLVTTSMTSYVVFQPNFNQIIVENNTQAEKVLNLPDGTSIRLVQGGTITYPKHFSKNERLIALEGEAFFEVAKNKNKPFIITTRQTKTRVVGTSFRISENNKQTAIVVHSGVVEFMEVENPSNKLRLTKGDKARFFEKKHALLKRTEESNNNHLIIKQLIYQNEKLETICSDLNELFNADIRLEGKQIQQLSMTATFEDQDLDSILESISFSLNLVVEKKDNYILLK